MRAIAVYPEVSSANFGDGSDKPADTRVLWVVVGGNGCIGAVVRGCSDCRVFVQRIFQAAEPGVSRGPWSDFAGLHGVQSGAGIQRAAGGAVGGSCGRTYRDSDRYRAARLGIGMRQVSGRRHRRPVRLLCRAGISRGKRGISVRCDDFALVQSQARIGAGINDAGKCWEQGLAQWSRRQSCIG